MPTYRIDDEGNFLAFEPSKAEELEFKLEDWLEQNEHVLLAPEPLLYIGRQVTTNLNKSIDLLAVDARGRLVVVELKKDRTPRDMVAQALEYAAFVRKLDHAGISSIAGNYLKQKDATAERFEDAFREAFPETNEAEELAWNARQTIILVGQSIQPDIIEVARYLRDHDIDIRVLQFVHFKSSSGERIVNVETVVGTEPMPSEVSITASGSGTTYDQVLDKVPQVRSLFEELRTQFKAIKLVERLEPTTIAFDLPSDGPVINMWPSPAGRVIVLALGRRVKELIELRDRVRELGIFVREGKSQLSFHLYPAEQTKVAALAKLVADRISMEPPLSPKPPVGPLAT